MVRAFRKEIGVYRSVLADKRCPRLSRWLLGAAVVYALSPIDLIPDFIPVLGHLDDLLVIPLLVWLAVLVIPGDLIAEHRASRTQEGEEAPRTGTGREDNNALRRDSEGQIRG